MSCRNSILHRIKVWYLDLRIIYKIMMFYFILLIVSVVISSMLYQRIYYSIMSSKVSDVSMQTLDSISSNIYSTFDNINNYSKVILSNDDIQGFLRNANTYMDLPAQRRMDTYLTGFMEAVPVISSVYIFNSNNYMYGVDKATDKRLLISDITKSEWYGEVSGKKGSYILTLNAGGIFGDSLNENYISLIRIVNDVNTQLPIGVLVVNVSESSILKSYSDITSKYETRVILKDEKNRDIVKVTGEADFDFKELWLDFERDGYDTIIKKGKDKIYLVSYLNIERYGWKILSVMPFGGLSRESNIFSSIAIAVIVINGLLLFIGSIFISKLITNPIKKLTSSMEGIEKGEFKKVEIVAGKDEIGRLRDVYNIMVFHIEELINRIIKEQKVKRIAELNVLQAQIKPHFLYNTFDAISSLALCGRTQEVYTLMKALGSFYRISLSKGSEVITIGEEIDNVKSYLTIQNYRYGDLFEANYDIDERVSSHKTLKLILQPLVENALYHGIKQKGEKGTIAISAQYASTYIKLTVEDDGVGMSQNAISMITEADVNKQSFGLRGTVERLRIFYGTDDILSVESELGKGTRITIMIPLEGELENVN